MRRKILPVAAFLAAVPLAEGRRWRVQPVTANGQPAAVFSAWDEQIGAYLTHGLSVFTFGVGGITAFTTFLDPSAMG